MGDGPTSIAQSVQHGLPREAQSMIQTNLKIAAQHAPRFFRDGAFHMGAEQRHPDQGPDANGDTGEEIEKVSPGSPGFPPGHPQDEGVHRSDAAVRWSESVKVSDSMRPSRKAITRSIEDASV